MPAELESTDPVQKGAAYTTYDTLTNKNLSMYEDRMMMIYRDTIIGGFFLTRSQKERIVRRLLHVI